MQQFQVRIHAAGPGWAGNQSPLITLTYDPARGGAMASYEGQAAPQKFADVLSGLRGPSLTLSALDPGGWGGEATLTGSARTLGAVCDGLAKAFSLQTA